MSLQSTIFMALEQPTTTLQQQQQQQQVINCDYCHKHIPNNGKFFIIDDTIRFFDSYTCKKYFIQRNEGRKRKLRRKMSRIQKCVYCNKEFDPLASTYKRKCCSKKCLRLHQYTANKRYGNGYFWCDMCNSWIPKEQAEWKQYKITRRAICPKLNCNGNKLKTRSTNYKSKNNNNKREDVNVNINTTTTVN